MRRAATLLALALAAAPARASFFKSKPKPVPPAPASAPAPRLPGPYDPLSASEIETCVSTLKASGLFSSDAVFPIIALREPAKDEPAGPRQAEAFVIDSGRGDVSEAVVDLAAAKLVSWRLLPEAQHRAAEPQRQTAAEKLAEDPAWTAALERRNLTPRDVVIELLPTGAPASWAEAFAFLKPSGSEKAAKPLAGLSAVVDLSTGKAVEVDEAPGFSALSAEPAPATVAPVPAPAPARAPNAPVFTPKPALSLEGYSASWRGWRFTITPSPREGFVLHAVSFENAGVRRSVLYRASLSELLNVSPQGPKGQRLELVEGELGLGRFARPLVPGADVPAEAATLDAVCADDQGNPYAVSHAVALYERQAAGGGKELVAVERFAVGARRYGLTWRFREDGELDAGVEAQAAPASPAAPLSAGAEQDFFSFRLDAQVDGSTSSVVELDAAPRAAGPVFLPRVLRTEHEARRDLPAQDSRFWVVTTSQTASAYALLPGKSEPPLLPVEAPARKRAGFINHALWVTRYRPEELYAAGEFPSLTGPVDGLERWTLHDESLENVDLVLWYTLGLTTPARAGGSGGLSMSSGLRLAPWAFPKP